MKEFRGLASTWHFTTWRTGSTIVLILIKNYYAKARPLDSFLKMPKMSRERKAKGDGRLCQILKWALLMSLYRGKRKCKTCCQVELSCSDERQNVGVTWKLKSICTLNKQLHWSIGTYTDVILCKADIDHQKGGLDRHFPQSYRTKMKAIPRSFNRHTASVVPFWGCKNFQLAQLFVKWSNLDLEKYSGL